jgi:hypothetical protein
MSKGHTPGPWRIDTQDSTFVRDGCTPHRGIAEVYGYGYGRPQAEANALLIAAAPELLEVCRLVVAVSPWIGGQAPQHDAINAMIRKANTALSKATGEQEG